ncbi:hypothetical protein AN416_06240 [Paraburkholderia caribensis]|nr:hypothetical protein AN416_06240 [Paraburkholderia caribensis]AUT52529.1 hypothetical protein C2L66_12190 [Paraburkholderia caribensis]
MHRVFDTQVLSRFESTFLASELMPLVLGAGVLRHMMMHWSFAMWAWPRCSFRHRQLGGQFSLKLENHNALTRVHESIVTHERFTRVEFKLSDIQRQDVLQLYLDPS